MSLADVVVPVTPYTVLKWFGVDVRDRVVEHMPVGEIAYCVPIKEGVCAGMPFYIYNEPNFGDRPFFGRSMAIDSTTVRRAARWERIPKLCVLVRWRGSHARWGRR